MEERSLRVYDSEKTFFSKLTNTLTKIIIPTQVGINSMLTVSYTHLTLPTT